MNKSQLFVTGCVLIIVLIAFFSGGRYERKKSDLYIKELERKYEQQLNDYHKALRESQQLRDSAVDRYNDLLDSAKNIRTRDSVIIDSLKKVKGKYKPLTDKQTEDAMIKKWKDRQ